MPRTEDSQQDIASLKEQIKGELIHDQRKKKTRNCFCCFGVWLVLVTAPILIGAWAGVKSGLFDIGGFSRYLYHPPEQTRVVQPVKGLAPENVLQTVAAKASIDRKTGLATFTFTEQDVTTLLQSFVQTEADAPKGTAQAMIEPPLVEVFAAIPTGDLVLRLLLKFEPGVAEGKLALVVKEAYLGSLAIHPDLVSFAVGAVLTAATGSIQEVVGQIGTLEEVKTGSGKLLLIVRPKK